MRDTIIRQFNTVYLNSAGIELVKKWINNPETNNGIIFADEYNYDSFEFYSKDAGYPDRRPTLTITYGSPHRVVKDVNSQNSENTPDVFELAQNYPNPFNPSTLINYSIPEDGFVKLVVYDILGKEIAVLADSYKSAGRYTVNFDASHYLSGSIFLSNTGRQIFRNKENDFD